MKIEAGVPLTEAAVKFADRTAVTDSTGQSLTYTELRQRANRFGSALEGLGLAQGDSVAVLSHNRNEVVEIWLGSSASTWCGSCSTVISRWRPTSRPSTRSAPRRWCSTRGSPMRSRVRGDMPKVRPTCASAARRPRGRRLRVFLDTGDTSDPRIDIEEETHAPAAHVGDHRRAEAMGVRTARGER